MHELQNAFECSEKQLKANQFSSDDSHEKQEMPTTYTQIHTRVHIDGSIFQSTWCR